jgi:cellulose synthase/poly-beta-1,6-N-acetylglucosamine synthase-like glycosyltransferase
LLSTYKRKGIEAKKISIGVCAYNEEKNIGSLLKNLLTEQDLPFNCEIIVVCSGCTDSTPQIVDAFRNWDKRVQLVSEIERRGKARALNSIFARASSSEILILTNADAFPESGSILRLVKALEQKNLGAVAGRPIPLITSRKLSNKIVQLIWDLHHEVSLGESVKMSGELCALRPSFVKEIPTNLATDEPYIEMLIRRQGYKIAYDPDALVYVRGPENIMEIIKHRRRIWSGHLQIKQMEGYVVSTSDFRKILSTLIKSFQRSLKKMPILAAFIVLEIYAYLLARYDLSKGRIPFVWETLKSTKL